MNRHGECSWPNGAVHGSPPLRVSRPSPSCSRVRRLPPPHRRLPPRRRWTRVWAPPATSAPPSSSAAARAVRLLWPAPCAPPAAPSVVTCRSSTASARWCRPTPFGSSPAARRSSPSPPTAAPGSARPATTRPAPPRRTPGPRARHRSGRPATGVRASPSRSWIPASATSTTSPGGSCTAPTCPVRARPPSTPSATAPSWPASSPATGRPRSQRREPASPRRQGSCRSRWPARTARPTCRPCWRRCSGSRSSLTTPVSVS